MSACKKPKVPESLREIPYEFENFSNELVNQEAWHTVRPRGQLFGYFDPISARFAIADGCFRVSGQVRLAEEEVNLF